MNDKFGVVTASDSDPASYSGLLLLLSSLSIAEPDLGVTVFDLGMTEDHLSKISTFPAVDVVEPADLPYSDTKCWQTLNKPFIIQQSPYLYTLWLDTDILVHTNLDYIRSYIKEKPFIVKNDDAMGIPHPDTLFPPSDIQPTRRVPAINAGVLGFDLERDGEFIDQWCDTINRYHGIEGINYYDQSALQLLLEKQQRLEWVEHDTRWNCHWSWDRWRDPGNTAFPDMHSHWEMNSGNFVRNLWPGIAFISHFCDSPKPYGDLSEVDLGDIKADVQSQIYCNRPAKRSGKGIILALDNNTGCVSGVRLLCRSLRRTNDLPVIIVDMGLEESRRKMLSELPCVEQILPMGELVVPQTVSRWAAWNKPVFMKQSPYKETLWLDTDIIVMGSLEPLFEMARKNPVLLEDAARHAWFRCEKLLPNKVEQYYKSGYLTPYRNECGPYTNTGIIAIDLDRDEWLIDAWLKISKVAAENQEFQDGIHWWDQGTMQWIVERYGRYDLILCEAKWNMSRAFEDRKGNRSDLDWMYTRNKSECVISHFCGMDKPYFDLTAITDEEIETALDHLFHV